MQTNSPQNVFLYGFIAASPLLKDKTFALFHLKQ